MSKHLAQQILCCSKVTVNYRLVGAYCLNVSIMIPGVHIASM